MILSASQRCLARAPAASGREPAPEVVDGFERPVRACGHDLRAVLVGKVAHLPQSQANRELVVADGFQHAVPARRVIEADRPDLDATRSSAYVEGRPGADAGFGKRMAASSVALCSGRWADGLGRIVGSTITFVPIFTRS